MSLVSWLNNLNLTTPLGLAVARVSGCRVNRDEDGWVAVGYRARLPMAAAFTVGSVVICREADIPPVVMAHERTHSRQYAWLGLTFLPAYAAGMVHSVVRTGDWWSRNPFERHAGLAAGGYRERPIRPVRTRRGGSVGIGAGG